MLAFLFGFEFCGFRGYISFKTVSFGTVTLSYKLKEETTTASSTSPDSNIQYPSFVIPETTTTAAETEETTVVTEVTTAKAEIEETTATTTEPVISNTTATTTVPNDTTSIVTTSANTGNISNANTNNEDDNLPTDNMLAAIIPIIALTSGITAVIAYNKKKK
ncbi:MAG: hypothetical protein NC452_20500 [Eubacterium sp.]|nr:hypothetical protein [Eubacterium sp.]